MSSAGPPISMGYPTPATQVARRADFRPLEFDKNIEMHGLRLAWSRACVCPCLPLNRQTNQADPSCELCQGAGYVYFNPRQEQQADVVGSLSDVQQKLITAGQSVVIRGLMTGMGKTDMPFQTLGTQQSGQATVTVRANNRLGHLDRLISLDAYLIHTERLEAPESSEPLPLRYLVDGGVNLLASLGRRYIPDVDFTVEGGQVRFADGSAPDPGTTLSAHYNCHPQYLVVDQPHATRVTYVPVKQGGLATPEGYVKQLPLMASVRLDWLVGQDGAGVLP